MDRRQHQTLELFSRIHAFLGTNKPQGDVASLDQAAASLSRVIESLRSYQKEQATLTRLGREQTAIREVRARRLVVGLMRPIARMALVVYPHEPTLASALRVPLRRRTEELVAAATSVGEVLGPRLDRFHEAGLAKDVLDQLQRAADELRELATTRALDRARRVASAEAIREQTQRGMTIIRLLEALVQLPLEGDVAQRAEWKSLMRRDVAQRAEWKSLMRRARQNGVRGAAEVQEVTERPGELVVPATSDGIGNPENPSSRAA